RCRRPASRSRSASECDAPQAAPRRLDRGPQSKAGRSYRLWAWLLWRTKIDPSERAREGAREAGWRELPWPKEIAPESAGHMRTRRREHHNLRGATTTGRHASRAPRPGAAQPANKIDMLRQTRPGFGRTAPEAGPR